MTKDVFSNHIGGASELTVLASIKQSFVPSRSLLSYGARLRVHLRMLSTLRRMGIEGARSGVYTGPLDSLRTLQYIRWTLIDDDTRMLLAVNFDRPLEPYLRRIVDVAGPLLDTILCHCEGFEGHSSDQGFHKFLEFANAHQAPVELFAAANPNMSVDDSDYFVQSDRYLRNQKKTPTRPPVDPTEQMLAELHLERPEDRLLRNSVENRLAQLDQGLSIVQTLFNNAHLFADDQGRNRDDLLYYRLLEKLTPGFWGSLFGSLRDEARAAISTAISGEVDPFDVPKAALPLIHDAHKQAYQADAATVSQAPDVGALSEDIQARNLINQHSAALDWYAKAPKARARTDQTPPANFQSEVQRGLLTGPRSKPRTAGFDVGCLMLLRIDDPAKGRAFLNTMSAELWPQNASEVKTNLSITYPGLKALKIEQDILHTFPMAFREGMAARAGLLGDVDINNPTEWVWPTSNWISDVNGAITPGPNMPIRPDTIDIIVQLVMANDQEVSEFTEAHPLFVAVEGIAQHFAAGVSLIGVEPVLRKYVGDKLHMIEGHLGFADGISQPALSQPQAKPNGDYNAVNTARRGEEEPDRTLIGDLLLGHPSKADLDLAKHRSIREDASAIKPYPDFSTPNSQPAPPDGVPYKNTPLENGTFQVIRKLRVNTDAFGTQGTAVQEQMVGRKRNGDPLDHGGATANDFNYKKDKLGRITPLQSHIRRTNPRQADTPRLLRKGFSYGPFNDPAADRGLMFIAYNANIAEQFEVVQRWISGGNSTGVSSYHGDPLLAPQRADSTRTFRYFEEDQVKYVKLRKTPPVTLQWGLYAFTPSKTGLQWFAKEQTSDHAPKVPVPPTARLKSFDACALRQQWKLALEDHDEERRSERLDLWKHVRDQGGAADASLYAVLVGSAAGVKQVLTDTETFSVREYWKRMLDSTGVIHLGMDIEPVKTASTDAEAQALDALYHGENGVKAGDYLKRSKPVNAFFRGLDANRLFTEAYEEAGQILSALPDELRYLPKADPKDSAAPQNNGRQVLVTRFFSDLVARLCVKWLGMPGTDSGVQIGGIESDTPHCPNDLIRASFYAFWPHPSDYTIKESQDRTQALRDAVRTNVTKTAAGAPGTLLAALLQDNLTPSKEQLEDMADMVVGVSSGFAGPTGGSFRFVMFDWIETGLLWRLQQRIKHAGLSATYPQLKPILEPAILDSMAKRSAPDILHRETVQATTIGKQVIPAGKRVVISLRSATEDAVANPKSGASKTDLERFFLFGGDYTDSSVAQPTHACPGQTMALCTMMAAVAAVMEYAEIRPEGPLSLRIHQRGSRRIL